MSGAFVPAQEVGGGSASGLLAGGLPAAAAIRWKPLVGGSMKYTRTSGTLPTYTSNAMSPPRLAGSIGRTLSVKPGSPATTTPTATTTEAPVNGESRSDSTAAATQSSADSVDVAATSPKDVVVAPVFDDGKRSSPPSPRAAARPAGAEQGTQEAVVSAKDAGASLLLRRMSSASGRLSPPAPIKAPPKKAGYSVGDVDGGVEASAERGERLAVTAIVLALLYITGARPAEEARFWQPAASINECVKMNCMVCSLLCKAALTTIVARLCIGHIHPILGR